MGAGHDDFVADLRIRSLNVSDDVVGVAILFGELRLDLNAELYRNACIEQSRDHVVVFGGQDQGRIAVRTGIATGDEDRSVFAFAGFKSYSGTFSTQHRVDLLS